MKILIFGAGGMLGHKLLQKLSAEAEVWYTLRSGADAFARYGIGDPALCIEGADVENEADIERAVETSGADVVINAVGIIKQLPTSADVIKTLTVNSIFPHRLARLSEKHGFRLFCISTDCVFDGADGNYKEDDVPNATDLYGKSKCLGEITEGNAVTLRTSIIGRELGTAYSLVEWFLSNRGGEVNGFTDAIYSGFPTAVLADIIKRLIFDMPEIRGLYHVSSEPINKFELLCLIERHFEAGIKITPSDKLKIDRSLDSTKFRQATGFVPDSWENMIAAMASDPTPYEKWRELEN